MPRVWVRHQLRLLFNGSIIVSRLSCSFAIYGKCLVHCLRSLGPGRRVFLSRCYLPLRDLHRTQLAQAITRIFSIPIDISTTALEGARFPSLILEPTFDFSPVPHVWGNLQ
jgi:hypothetical protein